LLASGFRPTAILCVNDFMALGVLRELHDRRIRVPEEVSVTGFDNINLAEFTYPPLTTVNIPRERIGRLVFEALVPQSDPAAMNREISIHSDLVIRDSTAAASS
jgi:DNA-binding LacI/PurR family transcriptional regulator